MAFPLAFNLFFRVCGKCKESVGFAQWKAVVNRLESPVLSRFHSDSTAISHDSSAILPIVRRLRSYRRSIAVK